MSITPVSSFPDLRLSSASVHKGRHYPCLEAPGAIYHLTMHLADSVPAEERRAWLAAREELAVRVRTRAERDDGLRVGTRAEREGGCAPETTAERNETAEGRAQREGGRAPETDAQRENLFCACPHAQTEAGLNNARREIDNPIVSSLSPSEREELKSLYNDRIERYLAAGYGSCLLRDRIVHATVRDVLECANGRLYALHLWCVMPNHLHIIVGGLAEGLALRKIVGDWKRILAHRINRTRSEKDAVWHEDTYTRLIRDEEEYRNQMEYVWHNPESAGLTAGFARECYVPFDFTICA